MNRNTVLPFIIAAACCANLLSAQPSRAQDQNQAVAHEQPFSTIQASINFTDNGSTLTVAGHATGMTPGLTYISFIYGPGSLARGTLACLPPTPNKLTAQQMVLGYWLPVNSPVRTLNASKTGSSYASLSAFATASIRYDSTPNVAFGAITPARYWLQTCGRATPSDGTDFLSSTLPGDDGN